MSDLQQQVDELRQEVRELHRAVETVTEMVERGRSNNTKQTAKVVEMINVLMRRVDDYIQSNVQTGTDRGATRAGLDEQGT